MEHGGITTATWAESARRAYDFVQFLPLIMFALLAENGPSWKTIASAVMGGAFTVFVAMGGYWIAQQDHAIHDLRDSYVEAKVTMAGMMASIKNLTETTTDLRNQVEYDRRRSELRSDQEHAMGKKN